MYTFSLDAKSWKTVKLISRQEKIANSGASEHIVGHEDGLDKPRKPDVRVESIEHPTTVSLVAESLTDNQPDQAPVHIDNSNCQEFTTDDVRNEVDASNRDHDKTNETIIEDKPLVNEKPESSTNLTVELNSGRRDSTSRRVSFPNLKGPRRFFYLELFCGSGSES